jgi:hypothetical protein
MRGEEMTNIISNSIVVIDVDPHGGAMAGMVKMEPIYVGFAATVFVVVAVVTLLVWRKKSK